MKLLFLVLSLFTSVGSFADQCEVLTDAQRDKAVIALEESMRRTGGFVSLCQNCHETKAVFVKAKGKVHSLSFGKDLNGNKSWTIRITNVKGFFDAAYMYAFTGQLSDHENFKWIDVAESIGCPYNGASMYIAEKNSGNLSVPVHTRKFFNGPKRQL